MGQIHRSIENAGGFRVKAIAKKASQRFGDSMAIGDWGSFPAQAQVRKKYEI